AAFAAGIGRCRGPDCGALLGVPNAQGILDRGQRNLGRILGLLRKRRHVADRLAWYAEPGPALGIKSSEPSHGRVMIRQVAAVTAGVPRESSLPFGYPTDAGGPKKPFR